MRVINLLACLLLTALPTIARDKGITVSTAFPGGSGDFWAVDTEAGMIGLHPSVHPGRGWPCWWYFRIDGLRMGETITVNVSRNPLAFRGNEVLPANWAQPDFAAISTNDGTWTQTSRAVISNGIAAYSFTATAQRMWVAWGPPFLPSHAEELVDRLTRSGAAARFELARTRAGRAVNGIRMGSGELAVWVHARQHAWEAGSSWVGAGFIEWLASEESEAARLRKLATIFFVPIMDVDNVALGAGGKEALPRDHNRDWAVTPAYPEVAAAQKRILELEREGRLRLFVDLHNPAPGDKRPYFYGPLDYETMESGLREKYDRFLALAAEEIRAPLSVDPKYRFATYVKTDEERARVSGTWVRTHTSTNAIALCLETAWNTPNNTQEDYRTVGRQFGKAMARYLLEVNGKQR